MVNLGDLDPLTLVRKQRDARESLCVKANMPKAYLCLQSPHVVVSHHVALPAAGVIWDHKLLQMAVMRVKCVTFVSETFTRYGSNITNVWQ